MRRAEEMPRRESRFSGRGRIVVAVLVAVFVVVALSLRGISGFYTDYLWFDSLDRTDVWGAVLGAKVVLWLIFFAVFFLLLWANLFVADRAAPPLRAPGPEEEMLARYHDFIGGRTSLVRFAVAFVFALLASAGAPSQWEEWLLFTNRQDFGVTDPQFDTDIGFYVFQLPFLSYVVDWAFASFVIVLILSAIAHYLNGGIRMAVTSGDRVSPSVKVHLSAILAVLALIKAAGYWLDRYELTVSKRGVVDGALYTDVNAQLPATHLLIAISLGAVVLLVVNLRRRGWIMPVIAVGLWAFVAIVMGGIYPAFVQRFQVEPNETTREAEYTQRNIDATRTAFGLIPGEDLTEATFDYTIDLTAEELREHTDTVRNARVLDPLVVHPTFERFQAEREFYQFEGGGVLDTDRYMIDGHLTQVVLGSRELSLNDLSWEREHVRLTHGYGLAIAQANVTTGEGRPSFLAGGLPVDVDNSLDLGLERAQLYIGEGLGGYALVSAGVDEIDFVDSATGEDVPTRYEGTSGVEMGSIWRRAAFAMRFGQIEPLISGFVTDETRVIYVRDVHDRVEALAPFLDFDADAYPVVLEGRVQYVIDAYTTTDRYPYAQKAENGRLDDGGLAGKSFNYVRNSVKAVVDAYDGDVTFYVMPVDDPIIEAWQGAFPDLFTDFDEMPDELRDHLRYPQDIFRVQTNMWARYQISDPESLVIGTERWAVAQNPGREVRVGSSEDVIDETGLVTSREERIDPYYTLLELPGEDQASYVSLRSFVPFDENDDRRELEAFMVAETRADGTTRLVTYEITSPDAPGPVLVASGIAQNEEISSRLTLLNDAGSEVQFGDLLMLPIADSILWVRPLYVAAQGSSSVPTLEAVIATVGEGEQIAIGNDLNDALGKLFPGEDFSDILGGAVIDIADEPDGPDDSDTADAGDEPSEPLEPSEPSRAATAEELLAEVVELYVARQAALAQTPPNEVLAAELQAQIGELLARAAELEGVLAAGDDDDVEA
ncbi:MAG: UPF0182 family protein [Acidimicrobiales bacterium]|nr:UPF0182 family protein [Acidimicrobiales bacterium]MDG1877835.1 UPF0182 family protein [Acidimicrobiales bacterium]